MTTLISAAVAAVVAALNTPTPVAPQVARVRLRPLATGQNTAVVVRPQHSQVQEILVNGLPASWATTIAVECYARTSAATTPDIAVDSLVESVYARLMAEPTLGGVVRSLRLDNAAYDFDADGEQATCVALTFIALHQAAGTTIL